ncbi:MAG: XdhC family protein [Pseudomonadota bacterium]
MRADLLKELNALRAERQAVVVITNTADGRQTVLSGDDLNAEQLNQHPLGGEIAARLKSGKSGMLELEGSEHFLQLHVPPLRMVVIGAVHISQALAPMALSCGYDLHIIDPRTAFASPERFIGVNLQAEWPQEVLSEGSLDPFTALAALTHDPKIDDFPLQAALDAGCFYVGALGSRKTHAKRVERLKNNGLSDAQLARIKAPIGLNIGAATPQEIAVAVMAQVIEAQRVGEGS